MSKINYEENYNELVKIVDKLQDENSTIDESIENFKRGVELYNMCKEKLSQANEQIVEILGDVSEQEK